MKFRSALLLGGVALITAIPVCADVIPYYDESVEIAGDGSRVPARARPHAATRESDGARDCGRSSFPAIAKRRSRARGMGVATGCEIFALQSLENSRNGEGISISREPVERANERPARKGAALLGKCDAL